MRNTNKRIGLVLGVACFLCTCVAVLYAIAAPRAHADDQKPAATRASAMDKGWTVAQLAQRRGIVFAHRLKDVPGKDLVVVQLQFSPHVSGNTPAPRCTAHTHPGSVWVYVTKGTARLGVEGGRVQTVHTGESFYEPKGAVHTVAESASDTEPASAIAVMIVPDGAALLTPAPCEKQ